MKLLPRILVPIFILLFTGISVRWMMNNRPPPQIRVPPPSITVVDATRLKATGYQVMIPSQGVVRPRTQSMLIPQVSGRIDWISANFRDGGFFEQGDELLKIDPRDYETAVVAAEATLAQRESALKIESAQHEQAVENWNVLGNGAAPNPLTLREPQLAEAKANVESAKARLLEAKRNLERTIIKAPYAGRILQKQVDVGQTVSPGNALATIFAIDYVEIRLPLINEHLDFLDLPERYRGEADPSGNGGPKVVLTGNHGSKTVTWTGTIVRADGAFDPGSRQLFVVAQVDDPYSRSRQGKPPLKVNQFVQASIIGHQLNGVFVIPRSAVRDNQEVHMIDKQNQIQRRQIHALWRDDNNIVVRDNLSENEVICLTPMMFAADGAQVSPTIDGVPAKRPGPPGGKRPGGKAGDKGGGKSKAGRGQKPGQPQTSK